MTGDEETATTPPGGAAASPEPAADSAATDTAGTTSASSPDQPARRGRRGRNRSFWTEFPVLIVIALAIALLIKTFVVQAFFIPSGSMQNTLVIRDKVLVNKLAYHFRPIRPGDVIVFDGAGSWTAPAPSPHSSDPLAEAVRRHAPAAAVLDRRAVRQRARPDRLRQARHRRAR